MLFRTASLFLGMTALLGGVVHANDDESAKSHFFDDTHKISVGATRQSTSLTIGVTTENFDPTPISLDDLGIDNSDNSYFVDYRYRFKPRWSLFAGAYSFSGTGQRLSTRDFNFDGQEFTANTQIAASLDIDTYMVDVLYAVHRSDNLEILLGGGLHALDFGVGISGRIEIDGEVLEAAAAGETLLAPVPNLRGSASWAVNDRVFFSLVGGWLSATVDEYDGDFTYAHLRGYYRFGEQIGVSVGYQITDIDITRKGALSTTSINAQLDGPTVTLTYSF
ncbi:outer membrane beta-barrel protein [Congregibacter brevis]|uniref:Outer membrane beta-barrel protein n=1 Tax=Congregibacter brevis TaxID=3081201 RepID=A0ABZ0ICG5_9GAMM|nr:outer membrane beta-barrel protein [Congregibacter sp. IMCC45268]